MRKAIAACWLLPLVALGCGGEDETRLQLAYDAPTLSVYRSALPSEERLLAGVPAAAADGSLQDAQGAAVLAGQGVVFARGVNETARDIARTLHTLAQQVPNSFSATRQRLIWGPWPAPTGPGEMTLEIQRDEAAELELSYELARQLPDQPETRTLVLWGAASPDAADPARSIGFTALDLDANSSFQLQHGGSRKALIGQGRFAIAYGHAERRADSVFFNLAAFRDFIPPSEGSNSQLPPVSVNHFYGRVVENSGAFVDFLHSELEQDLCDQEPQSCFEATPDGHPERLVFGQFLVDSGVGRADAALSGGDLADELRLTECWNTTLTRTSFRLTTSAGAQQMIPDATCPGRAAQTFDELGLPTRADIPEWLSNTLTHAIEAR